MPESSKLSAMTPLAEFLEKRNPRDVAIVEKLYKYLPQSAARLIERRMADRHMRSLAPRTSFRRTAQGGWDVIHAGKEIAQSLPLDHLVGIIERPVTIVATGPSAKKHDWERLKAEGRFVIAVAGASTFLKSLNIRPDLFVVSDSRLARRAIQHFHNAAGVPMVTVMRGASIHAAESPGELRTRRFSLIERVNSWYGLPRLRDDELLDINRRSDSPFHFADELAPDDRCGWSSAPELGFFSATTVTFVALQVAARLGATDIEIVGMDLSSAARVYDEGGKPLPNSLEAHYGPVILPSFQAMHRALSGSGVVVRNLSPVCPLPAELFS